jgi:hypothetical protein
LNVADARALALLVADDPSGHYGRPWLDKGDLKAGASFRAQEAAKQADGTYTTSRISVGRDGARPF